MAKLVIVESPAKAKTIGKYLGKDYEVTASMGHIRDLPASQLGIDIEHDYAPQYISIKGKEKLIKELKSKAKHSDGVLLATDPDREGEAISWHLANILGLDPHEPNRVTFDEITKKGVKEGMAHPRAINEDLFNAQQARRVLDRLVGYKLSPFLWRKVRRGLSAGRVQSVAVRIIDDREKEIEAFKPEEYWNVDATLGVGRKSFTARLASDDKGKKLLPHSEAEARAIEKGLEGAEYTVGELKKGKRAKQPTPAFITSTLQQEASRRLGFTATRTMRAAQTLYEGVDIAGHGTMGLITYMRTDSLRISDEAVAAAREYIAGAYGESYICPYKRTWKTKSATAAQDAHEAIRPSVPGLTPDEVDKSISGDTAKLYRMIWSRFMASQMADCQQDTVSVTVYAGGYRFKASGYTVTFDGFTALYEEATDEKEKKETSLPPLEEGQVLKLRELKSEQKFTQPPARYTEATLIKALEENGIGRPSTYAPTVSIILSREYVVKEGRALRPTPLGEVVTGLMEDKFHDVVDPTFTARMEENLDEVEAGKKYWKDLLRQFYSGFKAELDQAEKDLDGERIKVPDELSDEVCDLCGKQMVIKSGRFGRFLACPGYPECTFTKPLVIEMPGRCPKCGGRILKKTSRNGYTYYGCEHNRTSKGITCDFMTWDVPVKDNCPICGQTMFKKSGRGFKKPFCINEKCPNFLPEDQRGYKKKPAAKTEGEAGAEGTAAEVETAAKKTTAKKSAAKKSTTKKATTKKTTTKKATTKKASTAKKTTKKQAEEAVPEAVEAAKTETTEGTE